MVNRDLANAIIQEGKNYLLSFNKVSEDILNQHINEYKTRHTEIKSLSGLYRAMLESARSTRHMPKVINKLETLTGKLYDFDPNKVIYNYKNDYNFVFKAITPNRINNAPHNSWVKFSKTVISAANFLSQFNNLESFIDFTKAFTANPISRIGLPLLLKEEIFGFGFALACDFIKETISPEYVKPDTHIIYIFKNLGISRQNASDYEIFKDAIEFSEISQQVPYAIDKIFWLIGSGNFYRNNLHVKTNKQEFVEQVKNNLRIKS